MDTKHITFYSSFKKKSNVFDLYLNDIFSLFPQWRCTESHHSMTWQSFPVLVAARPPRAGVPQLFSTEAKLWARMNPRSPATKPRTETEPRNLTSRRAWIQANLFSPIQRFRTTIHTETVLCHPDQLSSNPFLETRHHIIILKNKDFTCWFAFKTYLSPLSLS